MVALAVVGASTLASFGLRPSGPGPRVLTDASFVRAANQACDHALPDLRPQSGGPFGVSQSPTQVADQVNTASKGLDGLASQLDTLPVVATDAAYVKAWLADWHEYTAFGRQYADWLRVHSFQKPPHLIDNANQVAQRADRFATANGLKACTFFATYRPDPSNGI